MVMSQVFNRLRYRFKYNYGRYLNLKAPVDVSLELSSACNMKCSYCYHADPKNLPFKPAFMNKLTAYDIITNAWNLGVNSLKFNWKGESTLNPDFEVITKCAKDMAEGSIFIDRLSNSNFQFKNNREDIFRGMANQTKVKISYDSFNKEVFEAQRKGGNHALVTKNIDTFYNHPNRIKSETQIVIQAVRTTANKDEDILGQSKKRWPEATVSIRDMVEGRVETDISRLAEKERDDSKRQPCDQAFVRLIFNHQGKAYPCCPDVSEKLFLGSIQNNTLREIFNGYRAKGLRHALKKGSAFSKDPCQNCSSFESYKGYKRNWQS